MGIRKAKEPLVPKEAIRPAIVISTTTDPLALGSLANNRAQATANPAVYGRKGPPITVLEIAKPTSECGVDVIDDGSQTIAMVALGLGAEGILELLQTLLAGPTCATLEVVAEEVKSQTTNCGVDQTRLFRMKAQVLGRGQRLYMAEGLFGFSMAAAHDDKVIGVAHHLETSRGHGHIDRVQVQIGEQRTDDSTNAKDNLASTRLQTVQVKDHFSPEPESNV